MLQHSSNANSSYGFICQYLQKKQPFVAIFVFYRRRFLQMRPSIVIPFIAVLCLLFVSCDKNDSEPEAPEALPLATIKFSSPSPNTVYNNGDSIAITATAISTESIHGYDLAIRNAGDTTSSLYFIHIHDHNDTIYINEKWKSAVASLPANLNAEIVIYVDHNGHTQKEKVGFRVQ
jgi:hypothetical protein